MKANGCGEKTEILSQGPSDAMTPWCPSYFPGCSSSAGFERVSSLPPRCPHFCSLSPRRDLPFLWDSHIKQIIHQWLSTGHISPRSSLPEYPLPLKASQLSMPKTCLTVMSFLQCLHSEFPNPPIYPMVCHPPPRRLCFPPLLPKPSQS